MRHESVPNCDALRAELEIAFHPRTRLDQTRPAVP